MVRINDRPALSRQELNLYKLLSVQDALYRNLYQMFIEYSFKRPTPHRWDILKDSTIASALQFHREGLISEDTFITWKKHIQTYEGYMDKEEFDKAIEQLEHIHTFISMMIDEIISNVSDKDWLDNKDEPIIILQEGRKAPFVYYDTERKGFKPVTTAFLTQKDVRSRLIKEFGELEYELMIRKTIDYWKGVHDG